eukprot:1521080-Amphidinium_carterae.1
MMKRLKSIKHLPKYYREKYRLKTLRGSCCHPLGFVLLVGICVASQDKPPTMPVHPSGAYYHNTLMHILASENEKWRDSDGVAFSKGLERTLGEQDRASQDVAALVRCLLVCVEVDVGPRDSSQDSRRRSQRCPPEEYLARVTGRFPEGLPDSMPEAWKDAQLTEATASHLRSAETHLMIMSPKAVSSMLSSAL